jgi:hypothetical protein
MKKVGLETFVLCSTKEKKKIQKRARLNDNLLVGLAISHPTMEKGKVEV